MIPFLQAYLLAAAVYRILILSPCLQKSLSPMWQSLDSIWAQGLPGMNPTRLPLLLSESGPPRVPLMVPSHPGWSTRQLPSHPPRLSGIHLLCEICPTKQLLRKMKYYFLCSPNTLCILSLWQLSQFIHKLLFLINPVKPWLPHRTIHFISFIHFYNAKNNI